MAESLDDIINRLNKQLKLLETPKSKEAEEAIKKSLKDRMNLKKKRDHKSIYARSTWSRMWSTSDKDTIICG